MFRTARRVLGIAAATLLPAAFLVPAAQADIKIFPDVGGYITGVRVSHGPKSIAVTSYDQEFDFTTEYRFWLDTDPDDPGPDYRVDVFPDSDGLALEKVTTFSSPGTEVACSGIDAIADSDGPEYVKIFVPRSCMGTPESVKVSVVAYYDDPDVTDWAPGERRFYPWVDR